MGPAPVGEDLERIAAALPRNVYLGTSSWSFPGWEGLVYDRPATKGALARHGLAAYARHPLLRAVGIDRTYYAPVPASVLAAYAAEVPEDFRFLVKASSLCTTPLRSDGSGPPRERNPSFLDVSYAVEEVVGPFVDGLGAGRGVLLFQFPPLGAGITREPSRFVEALGGFLQSLPRGPAYAVELRDGDLFSREYVEAVEAAGARHCLSLHPRMPPPAEQLRLAPPADPLSVRWMLHAGLGYEQARSRYEPFSRLVDEDPANRRLLAGLCLDHARSGRDVILIANNKAEGSAPLTVSRLAAAIARGVA